MTEEIKKPKLKREVASIKSTNNVVYSLLDNFLESNDTVLQSLGGDYSVYDEILRDDQVKACFQQRRLAVVSSELIIEPGGDSQQDKACAEALKAEVDFIKFDNLTDKMLYDQFYGFAVSEIIWEEKNGLIGWKSIKARNRARFSFNKDCTLILKPNSLKSEKINCEPPYFWVTSVGATHDDEPYGLGLAHYLYWPVIFKRGGIKFWMKFLERFAQPSMLGKFDPLTATDEDISNLLTAMKSLASETGTIMPNGMSVELIEATRSGSVDQAKLIEIMDSAISKIILGQTMTTDNGSSKSQAQVHFEVRQDIIDSDAKLQCESFKDGPATWFTMFNFADAEVPKISRKTHKDEKPSERVKTDVEKTKLGFSPTQEYFDAYYGEGWIKNNQDKVSKLNFSEFAESQFPDQKELDDALDSITDSELNNQMSPIIDPILDFAEKHGPEKTLKKMDEVYNSMDIEDLTDQLTQMLFVAEMHGRFNASK